jgi:hypothetical protein
MNAAQTEYLTAKALVSTLQDELDAVYDIDSDYEEEAYEAEANRIGLPAARRNLAVCEEALMAWLRSAVPNSDIDYVSRHPHARRRVIDLALKLRI